MVEVVLPEDLSVFLVFILMDRKIIKDAADRLNTKFNPSTLSKAESFYARARKESYVVKNVNLLPFYCLELACLQSELFNAD
jgi:hypothetical protein